MKKTISIFITVLVMVIFCGCPYESLVPIDNPTVPINQKLIGKWNPGGQGEVYHIKKQDEFHYAIESEKENKKESYTAFLSDVNGTLFLNLSENKAENNPKKYLFYKIELVDDNSLKIYPVSENVREKFKTKEEMKKFIADNMKNSYLFEKEGTLTKMK